MITQFSQNFIQIYGQSALFGRFVRKFLAIMMRFYGPKVVFDNFVRNRHFSSKIITDKAPIFIDVAVNDSDFDKCSD
jgi:hypothetical protein